MDRKTDYDIRCDRVFRARRICPHVRIRSSKVCLRKDKGDPSWSEIEIKVSAVREEFDCFHLLPPIWFEVEGKARTLKLKKQPGNTG